MRVAVQIPSYKRPNDLIRFLNSLVEHRDLFPPFDVYCCCQVYSEEDRKRIVEMFPWVNFFFCNRAMGPGGARAIIMNYVHSLGKYDLYFCNDDDAVITEHTNIWKVLDLFSGIEGVGLVSLAQHEYVRHTLGTARFVKSPYLATAGGLLFSPIVIDVVGNWHFGSFVDDSELSLRAYLYGFDNYYTSVAASKHRGWRKDGGGKMEFYRKKPYSHFIIGLREYVRGDIGYLALLKLGARNITEGGKELHHINRKILLEKLKKYDKWVLGRPLEGGQNETSDGVEKGQEGRA